MIQETEVGVALDLLDGRLHKAAGDARCACGPCTHQIVVAARRAGTTREEVEAALLPAPKPEPARPRRRPTPRVRIAESCSIRARGRDVGTQEGLAVLLERLHRES